MSDGFGKLGTSARRKRRKSRRIVLPFLAGIAYHQSDATSGAWEGLLRGSYTPPTACRVCGGTPISPRPWTYDLCGPCDDSRKAAFEKWNKRWWRSRGRLEGDPDVAWEAKRSRSASPARAVAEAEAAVRDAEWERRAGDEP